MSSKTVCFPQLNFEAKPVRSVLTDTGHDSAQLYNNRRTRLTRDTTDRRSAY